MGLLAVLRGRVGRWLGDERLGMLDYWRRPEWRETWGGPFNGQTFRQRMFAELCSQVRFVAIIETGTHRGSTTAYFRRTTRVPIYSFELRPRYYGFARARLRHARDVHLHRGDSRAGIASLAAAGSLPQGPVFFYLDAHWQRDLPLAEEVDLAFGHCPQAVVMIDDFVVPDDAGYGFDDYGPNRKLSLGYLGPRVAPPTAIWFPACDSRDETGERRGCVVLARETEMISLIEAVRALRRWTPVP